MKNKILYSIATLALLFTACDPLEDTYNELDKVSTADSVKKTFSYTLVKADYDQLKSKTGGKQYPATISGRQSFASSEEAALYIPDVLLTKYPQFTTGSEVTVEYNQFLYAFVNNTISNRVSYTLVDGDYPLGGVPVNKNFDRWSQVETFLKAKYPGAKDSLVTLTYTAYNSNTNPTSKVVTDDFFFKNGQWYDTYRISAEEYASVDRGRFGNFVADDQPILVDYFNKFLKAKLVAPRVNDFIYVSYAIRVSSTTQEVMGLRFDGTNWVKLADNTNVTIPATLKFAKKAGVWKPDLSISYNFTTADYQAIAEDVNIGTEANRANLKQFNNFYQTSNTSDTRNWTDEQVKAGIAAHLKRKFPNAEVDQKYRVTFVMYKGANTTTVWEFEKKASGDFEFVD